MTRSSCRIRRQHHLTNDGDVWTIHYTGGEDHIKITGVTQLGHADYVIA